MERWRGLVGRGCGSCDLAQRGRCTIAGTGPLSGRLPLPMHRPSVPALGRDHSVTGSWSRGSPQRIRAAGLRHCPAPRSISSSSSKYEQHCDGRWLDRVAATRSTTGKRCLSVCVVRRATRLTAGNMLPRDRAQLDWVGGGQAGWHHCHSLTQQGRPDPLAVFGGGLGWRVVNFYQLGLSAV